MKKKELWVGFALTAIFAMLFIACNDGSENGIKDDKNTPVEGLIHQWLLNGNGTDSIGGKNLMIDDEGKIFSFEADTEWNRQVLNSMGSHNTVDFPWNGCWVNNFNSAPMTELTVSLWIYPTDTAGIRQILILETPNGAGASTPNAGLFIFHFYNGLIDMGYRSTATNLDINSPTNYRDKWVHLALTFKNDTASLYVNGEKAGEIEGTVECDDWWDASGTTVDITMRIPKLDSFWIGGMQPTQHYIGKITDVRFYNKVLNLSEITNIINEAPQAVRDLMEDEY
jgi:hypothetical protein